MTETREKIVDLADSLIRTRGYNGFSYADISSALRVRNAAVHYHFPAKELLGRAVIAKHTASFRVQSESWNTLDEQERIEHLIESFSLKSSRGESCLMGALLPEYSTLPAAMQRDLTKLSDEILRWTEGVLASGRRRESLYFNGTPRERALAILSSLMASLLVARTANKAATETIGSLIIADLTTRPLPPNYLICK